MRHAHTGHSSAHTSSAVISFLVCLSVVACVCAGGACQEGPREANQTAAAVTPTGTVCLQASPHASIHRHVIRLSLSFPGLLSWRTTCRLPSRTPQRCVHVQANHNTRGIHVAAPVCAMVTSGVARRLSSPQNSSRPKQRPHRQAAHRPHATETRRLCAPFYQAQKALQEQHDAAQKEATQSHQQALGNLSKQVNEVRIPTPNTQHPTPNTHTNHTPAHSSACSSQDRRSGIQACHTHTHAQPGGRVIEEWYLSGTRPHLQPSLPSCRTPWSSRPSRQSQPKPETSSRKPTDPTHRPTHKRPSKRCPCFCCGCFPLSHRLSLFSLSSVVCWTRIR